MARPESAADGGTEGTALTISLTWSWPRHPTLKSVTQEDANHFLLKMQQCSPDSLAAQNTPRQEN